MTTSFSNFVPYSRYNLSESESDIRFLIRDYRERVITQMIEQTHKNPFLSFAEKKLSLIDLSWLQDNYERFIKDTANDKVANNNYLSDYGFITCMAYSENGEYVITGHSSGLIQASLFPEQYNRGLFKVRVNHLLSLRASSFTTSELTNRFNKTLDLSLTYPSANPFGYDMEEQKEILSEYIKSINESYEDEHNPKLWYPMFHSGKSAKRDELIWVQENFDKFLKGTPNEILYNRWYFSEMGFITALKFAPNGSHIIVAHSSGLIQMRHGTTGTVMCTLRTIQFPPKPIYALEYSKNDDRICYASSMDGIIYRIEIPPLTAPGTDPPQYCIRVDPALECLTMQFYGAPGISSHATPFITQRSAALSLGLSADQTKMVVGYADTSIKVYDMETQEVDITYKVHKLRLQFIPKKLQRMHFGQVCALRCHPAYPYMFASGSWDKTLRIWDVRCKVGCVMTFEGVDICSDSIDLNRNQCIAGSWKPTEALTVWDLIAKKRISVVRVQNRRPDVDGEYIYACRYWHSTDYNRKGKYAIIGGSGTNCVEVINLHNRYITCSYPAAGTVLAVASHEDKIAFGGTSTTFNIVQFHDPKHEKDKYHKEEEPEFDYTKSLFEDTSSERLDNSSFTDFPIPKKATYDTPSRGSKIK